MDTQYSFYKILSLFLVLIIFFSNGNAQDSQRVRQLYHDYIKANNQIAIQNMREFRIPASITLAQGILESGAGKGYLAINSNNHFGIKCHTGWQGDTFFQDDDEKNECFRKYSRSEESFNDHARFLTSRPRYKNLFYLDITDYEAWAKGLQNAGYATDRSYANKLIRIIKDYQLYSYDNEGKYPNIKQEREMVKLVKNKEKIHIPYKTQGLVYIIAFVGDSYESIAKEFNFNIEDLCRYNEVPQGFALNNGDIVYFQPKKIRADSPYFEHVVKSGESVHSISQLYGVRMKNIYTMNNKDFNYVPEEGQVLRLR